MAPQLVETFPEFYGTPELAWFQTSATKLMINGILWLITQRIVVLCDRKMGPIGCPETSVRNYHNLLLKDPEEPCYSTPKFITFWTTASYLFLSSARLIPSTSFPSELKVHFNILPSTPRSSKWSRSNRFPRRNPVCISFIRSTCLAHLIIFDLITRVILGEECRSWRSWLCGFSPVPVTSSLLGPVTFLNTVLSNILSELNKLNQLDVTYESFLLLNMFRMLLHSSSGADDCM